MDDWPIAREYSTRNRVANFVWSLADCCSSFRHLRFVNKEALLSCDLPMAPSSFRTYVKERCKELNHFLQRRSLSLLAIRSTQPCIPPGSLNRVPALAGETAGMSPLPGGR